MLAGHTQKPPRSLPRRLAVALRLRGGVLRRAVSNVAVPTAIGRTHGLNEAAGALPACRANDPDSVGCVISNDADQASVAVPSMKMAVRVLSQAAPRKRATLASRPSVVVWPFVLDPCDPLSR